MNIPEREQLAGAARPLRRGGYAGVGDFPRPPSDAALLSVYAADAVDNDGTVGGVGVGETEYAVQHGAAACGDEAAGKGAAAATLKDHVGALWQWCRCVCCLAAGRAFRRRIDLDAKKRRSASTRDQEGGSCGVREAPRRLCQPRAGSLVRLLRILGYTTSVLTVSLFFMLRDRGSASVSKQRMAQPRHLGVPLLDCDCASGDVFADFGLLNTMLTESRTTIGDGDGDKGGHSVASGVRRLRGGVLGSSSLPTNVGCVARNPLSHMFLHREAVPWMTITAAAHRTREEWAADPRGRESLLPFPVPSSAEERERLRQELQADPTRLGPIGATEEISIATTDRWTAFRSYLCSDITNATTMEEYYMDPVRALLLDRMEPAKEARHPAPLVCDGCAFHCVHPRLVREGRARRCGAAGSAPAECSSEDALISWTVALDDVDAGTVRVPSDSGDAVVVTRDDLFTCKVLNRKGESPISRMAEHNRQDATNRALLLSSDVWLTHFNNGLPLFFANDTRASRQGVGDGGDVPIKRLMPLHTSVIHGESLQTYSYYALQTLYWLQYDSVYLQNVVRRPDQLPLMPTASGKRAPARTSFRTWTMTSTYLRDFQLVVYFNVLRRRLLGGERENASTVLTADDVPAVLPWAPVAADGEVPAARAMATGELARLGFEVLQGTDPMVLPMHGENALLPPRPVAWRPQTSAEWSGRVAVDKDAPSPPPSTPSRIRAIAAMISNCHHNRMQWLSELSRYYPVHNYGSCVVPRPTPLPGDAVPTPGIPQRSNLPFPSECLGKSLLKRHKSVLASMRTVNASLALNRRVTRRLLHGTRDHGVRCVFRRYRYVLPFENSIEDDYVTEKVYNALLSGALPLYVGAMNIADYVPGASRGAGKDSERAYGLSVIPVLQMFPLLNETAWRREADRVVALQERDEVMVRQVQRTHAAVLRAQASTMAQAAERDGGAAARYASAMATASTVASALEAAQRASLHVSQHHYLLYTDPVHSMETAALKETYGEGAKANGLRATETPSDSHTSAMRTFASADGAWPPPWSAPLLLTAAEATVAGHAGGAGHVVDNDSVGTAVSVSTDASAYLLGYGQCDYLQRVHRDAREVVTGAAAPKSHRAQRRERLGLYKSWALTPNTALGFVGEVAERGARRATPAKMTRRAVEVFPELRDGDAMVAREANWTRRRAQGDMYSSHFNRVGVPHAPAYEREIAATAVPGGGEAPPPMNGFAQLAAYLRALDEDPALIDEAGYFDWWRAERMEDFGEAFLGALYREFPVCSICAAALEKKEADARSAAAGPTRNKGGA